MSNYLAVRNPAFESRNCEKCVHIVWRGFGLHECGMTSHQHKVVDPVTGMGATAAVFCKVERADTREGHCGPSGQHYTRDKSRRQASPVGAAS